MRAPEPYYPSITLVLTRAGVSRDINCSTHSAKHHKKDSPYPKDRENPFMRTVYPTIYISYPSDGASSNDNATSANSISDGEHEQPDSSCTRLHEILAACKRVWKKLPGRMIRQQTIDSTFTIEDLD